LLMLHIRAFWVVYMRVRWAGYQELLLDERSAVRSSWIGWVAVVAERVHREICGKFYLFNSVAFLHFVKFINAAKFTCIDLICRYEQPLRTIMQTSNMFRAHVNV
jgi:hypothetical protein